MSLSSVPSRIFYMLESEYSNDKSYALSWALQNLQGEELVEFYNYAYRYKPMMARTEQAMLDAIKDRFLANDLRFAYRARYEQDRIPQQVSGYHFRTPEYQHGIDRNQAMAGFQQTRWSNVAGARSFGSLGQDYSSSPDGPLEETWSDSGSGSQTGMSASDWSALLATLVKLGVEGMNLAAKIRAGDRDAELAAQKLKYAYDSDLMKARTLLEQQAALQKAQAAAAAAAAAAQTSKPMDQTTLFLLFGLFAAVMLMKK